MAESTGCLYTTLNIRNITSIKIYNEKKIIK